ncbi:MAG: protein-glutamate O-methyltransferase CheR [Gammaproteobacteria bacterium]|nr:protein-glutamate O-methyltransferase CheR [Gammaproteobacteria bacterium]
MPTGTSGADAVSSFSSMGPAGQSIADEDFRFIQRLVEERTGIVLGDCKRHMVTGRLARRLRQLGLDGFGKYCAILRDDGKDEIRELINAITTNLTAFFREPHHFDFLAQTLIPALVSTAGRSDIRIWSAGCSTGEEAYSLAISAREALTDIARLPVKILATDIDSNVLERAVSGVYESDRVANIAQERRKRWFLRGKGRQEGRVQIVPGLRDLVTFRQLNLLGDWPMRRRFDAIFCRNVVIYFDKNTQRRLFDRFAEALTDNGHLFIGHSESLFNVSDRFQLIGRTVYRKR